MKLPMISRLAFAELWREQNVGRFEVSRKRLRPPGLGPIDLDYVKLAATHDDQQHLIAFLPADAASARKLTALR
jgi:MmyB-like transcription regulator ligand binding domain